MLQANVMYFLVHSVYIFIHILTQRVRNLSKACSPIHYGLIKTMVQLRTNFFSLLQLQMLHIPSSPAENTAETLPCLPQQTVLLSFSFILLLPFYISFLALLSSLPLSCGCHHCSD